MNEVNKWYVDGVLESNIRNYVRNLIREAMEAGFSVQDLNNALTNDMQGVKDSSDYKDKINYFFENGYKYCVKMLGEPIGKGSARFVFQIDDTRVLKLATNMKGVAQNKSEVMVYQQAPNKTFMPIVYNDSDMENYFYVISEYVLPAEEKDFETVLGVPFYTLVEIFSNYYRGDEIKKYEEYSPKIRHLLQYFTEMSKIGVNTHDWFNLENWGLTKRHGKAIMVTLDNGLTNNVANNFYRNKSVFDGDNEFLGMMGYEDSYRQDREQQIDKRFSKVLPKDTVGQNVVEWAESHSSGYYKTVIEEIIQSNFQKKEAIGELIYDYIDEKDPSFDWSDGEELPEYAYDSVADYIKKMYSNVNN
jgi:hypothetical protein